MLLQAGQQERKSISLPTRSRSDLLEDRGPVEALYPGIWDLRIEYLAATKKLVPSLDEDLSSNTLRIRVGDTAPGK